MMVAVSEGGGVVDSGTMTTSKKMTKIVQFKTYVNFGVCSFGGFFCFSFMLSQEKSKLMISLNW